MGGDLKFLNSMLGLKNNASMYPCPFCITHKDLLGSNSLSLKPFISSNAATIGFARAVGVSRGRGRSGGRGRGGQSGNGKPTILHLGPRSNEMQMKLAHLADCECCPGDGCKKPISTHDEVELVGEADTHHHQHRFSTAHLVGIFFLCIKLEDVIIDALHVVLRVVPAIYRATVTSHVDNAECLSIAQWVFDTHRIIVSSHTAVQSATGREATIGTECWPGRVCDKLIQIYPEILDQVHIKDSDNMKTALAVWDAFLEFNDELVQGCDDDDQNDVERHAGKMQKLAETFVDVFKAASSSAKVTPYMHCMMVDIPRMILRHGSLMKFSAQGLERLHQWVKFITLWRSNKHHEDVGGTVMKGLTNKASAGVEMPPRRSGKKRDANNGFVKKGGNMSKVARAKMEEGKDVLMRAIAERKAEVD